jgi:hypothetical protein
VLVTGIGIIALRSARSPAPGDDTPGPAGVAVAPPAGQPAARPAEAGVASRGAAAVGTEVVKPPANPVAALPAGAPASRTEGAPAGVTASGAAKPPDAAGSSSEILTAKQMFFADSSASADARKPNAPPGSGAAIPNTGLRFRLTQQLPDNSEVEVDPDVTFHTGDRVRFTFESNVDGYLYVVQEGSSGRWTVLYPNPQINGGRNQIQRFQPLAVPPDNWFAFDAQPGTERVFVFLCKDALQQLPGFGAPVTKLETVSAAVVDDLRRSVQSRDLVFEKDRPAGAAGAAKSAQATYVVNREEVGKAVAATIQLVHGR